MQPSLAVSGIGLVLIVVLGGCGPSNPPGQKPGSPPAAGPAASPTNEGSVVTAPVDYIATVIRAGEQAKGTVEIATIQKAIDAFQAGEERFPESLDELAQKSYLNPLPRPPVGRKFQYNAASGKIELVPAN